MVFEETYTMNNGAKYQSLRLERGSLKTKKPQKPFAKLLKSVIAILTPLKLTATKRAWVKASENAVLRAKKSL